MYYQTAFGILLIVMGMQEKYQKDLRGSTRKILDNSNDNNVWYVAFL
jgi:hypothetical protein